MARLTRLSTEATLVFAGVFVFLLSSNAVSQVNSSETGATAAQKLDSAVGKWVGTVQSIRDKTVTVTLDAGTQIDIVVPETARVVRMAPGQSDLKAATPVPLADLQIGDRMLVRGSLSDDGKSVTAISALVMKQSEIAQKQENERRDWEKRGIGGLITSVDQSAGKVMVSSMTASGTSAITVNVSKNTIIRRYAPDSIKFNDARPSTLDQIKAGDQLRARGSRSPDGKEFVAEEIVSGSFRNIAGTISTVDAGQSIIHLVDLVSRKPMSISVTADSVLRKLPPQVAQMIAMRLRGSAPGGSSNGTNPGSAPSAASPVRNGPPSGVIPGGGRSRGEGAPDLQQFLSRAPSETLDDLKKGDAVIIVATQGDTASSPTVVTLLSGVEPILSASPIPGGAASVLSPWNLSAPGGESAAQ
ncbi:MAG: hypothetical protein QOD84_1610 [Acidobacteriaceae bacterium]|jgi:hypothetical protein